MSDIIAESHFKSYNRLYPMIHKQYPNMSKKEIREAIKKKFHDRHLKASHKRIYMNRIYDPVIGCYFHDLNKFINDNFGKPIVKLTSDGESAFDSKKFKDYCMSKNINIRIIYDRAHSSLGLIDRFIRTLRDLHQPIRKGEPEQRSIYMDNFTEQEMKTLINEYNNTFHKTIGCSPKEMYDNPELEREWIYKQEKFKRIQRNIEDFDIPIGSYVRYRMNKDDLAGGKRRSQFSLEKYRVIKRIGNRYILQPWNTETGGLISKSRFELILADDNYPYGKTFYNSQAINPKKVVDTNFNGNYGLIQKDGVWE